MACLPPAIRTAAWFTILTAFAAVPAYYGIFSEFAEWDDEGTQMMTVRQYLTGGRLYEEIYSGYGPVYFFHNWLVRSATGNTTPRGSAPRLCRSSVGSSAPGSFSG